MRKRRKSTAPRTSFLERTRKAYAGLSPAHQKVARFLIDSPREAAFLSAAELGSRVRVSDATVVRLAPALGYKGYPELRSDLQDSLFSATGPAALLRARSTTQVGVRAGIGLEIHNLELLQESMSDELVDSTARLVHGADRVFVIGLRMFFGVAHTCALLLGQILRNAVLLDLTAGALPDQLATLGERDVLIAFSSSRYARIIVDVANFARSRGCPVIAVTDSALAPVAQVASTVVLVSVKSTSFFASAIAAQAYVNLLVSTIAQRYEPKGAERLAEIDAAIEAFQTLLTTLPADRA